MSGRVHSHENYVTCNIFANINAILPTYDQKLTDKIIDQEFEDSKVEFKEEVHRRIKEELGV